MLRSYFAYKMLCCRFIFHLLLLLWSSFSGAFVLHAPPAFLSNNKISSTRASSIKSEIEPLLLRTCKGQVRLSVDDVCHWFESCIFSCQAVERTPVWMMRQAGRHMKVLNLQDCCVKSLSDVSYGLCSQEYRDLCAKHKTFRERSENADLATEIR